MRTHRSATDGRAALSCPPAGCYFAEGPCWVPPGDSGDSTINYLARVSISLFVAALGVAIASDHAKAQASPLLASNSSSMEAARTSPADGSRFRTHAILLGGVGGLTDSERHPYGGVELGGFVGRYGALVLGQYGNGNGFRSLLAGGGPAFQIADVEFASFSAYGGLAWYQEELNTGFARDLTGPYLALTGRSPLGIGALGVTLSVWRGSIDGEGFQRSTTVTGRRLSVGYGW